jgi:hypothetical protein
MNKLTADFFAADFGPAQVPGTFDQVMQNFWSNTTIPWVELDLELDLDSSYQWCLAHDNYFELAWNQQQVQKKITHEGANWYKRPHSVGRFDLKVTGAYPQKRMLIKADNKIEFDEKNRMVMPTAVPGLQMQLAKLEIEYTVMKLARLDPGGYLEPHKDTFHDTDTMIHTWIPLHPAENNLRVYPYGTLHHRVGCIYLLNNQAMIHSIANTSDQPRYVVTMRLEKQTLPDNVWQMIQCQVKNQWFDT